MKLLEVAPDFVRSQVGTLMTILQYLQSKTEAGTKIPMRNITNLMNNAGYSFNWEALEGLKKQFPALDELIGDANEEYITIGKNDEPDEDILGEPSDDIDMPQSQDSNMNEPPQEPTPSRGAPIGNGRSSERATVDKMAARAARF